MSKKKAANPSAAVNSGANRPLFTVPNTPRYLTTAEVCDYLRITEKTLQRWRKARKLTFVHRCGRFLFTTAEVDRFLEVRTVRAA
jgi:excisionase family DNA binding protein